jgi:hypothetical protein
MSRGAGWFITLFLPPFSPDLSLPEVVMKKTLVWILIAANVSLAGTLVWRETGNTANAAQVGQPLSRGKYVLIPGEASSASSIIYVFDAANERVGAITPDTRDLLVSMPTIGLREIFEKGMKDQTPANNNGRNPAPRPNNPRPR